MCQEGDFIMQENFFTTGKVSEILKVTKMTLSRWIKEGKLVPAKITDTGRYLFSEEQILTFQKRNIELENVTSESQKRNIELENVTLQKPSLNYKNAKFRNQKYEEYLNKRKDLIEQAKQYLPNYLQTYLGVERLDQLFQCPFHGDSTASMAYYSDSQRVYCFAGCNYKGYDIFDLHAELNHKPLNKELFDEVLEMYGLIDSTGKTFSKLKFKPVIPPPTAKKLSVDRSEDIAKFAADIEKIDYWKMREPTPLIRLI